MHARITRWGNSLGLRLPKDIAARVGVHEGSRVEIVVTDDHEIVLRPTHPTYTLDELLAGMTPEAMHEAFDWGPDLGREQVD